MKPGTGDIDGGNQMVLAQPGRDRFGEIARLGPGLLCQHHGRVGRHIAVRRIARRLDNNARQIGAGSKLGRTDGTHARKHFGE